MPPRNPKAQLNNAPEATPRQVLWSPGFDHPKAGTLRWEHDVACMECGEKVGVVVFDVPHVSHDPAASGLVCGDCLPAGVSYAS